MPDTAALSIPLSFRIVEMHATENAHALVLQENPRPRLSGPHPSGPGGQQVADTPPNRTVVEVNRPTFAQCFVGMVLELVPSPVQPNLGGMAGGAGTLEPFGQQLMQRPR